MPVTAHSANHEMLRNLDMLALVLALPVFILTGAPIVGYLAAGGAWVIGRAAMELAARRRDLALRQSNRNAALGITAFATMGRVWLLAGAILLVGLLADREAGLAAALLALVLVTFNLGAQAADHLLHPDPEGSLQ
ncbi:MAG: hypothetical protein H0V25_01550 [Solirubrobacterales bacterium]|nr:hypothetical protein [Solirubrobacterales bacterium]